jgi:predicted thioredoxin/glutaredoxin
MKNIKYILSKWYVVLACALITSGMLYIEKSKVNPSIQQTGDIIYTRIIKFNKVPTFTAGQTTTEIDLSKIMKMTSSQEYMVKMLNSNFRTSMLDKSFDKMSNLNKLMWVDKHFNVEK